MIPSIIRLTLGLPLLLSACGGGGGAGAAAQQPSATPVSFTSITITGTADAACAVTAHGLPDADGKVDKAWTVPLPMDGARLPAYTEGAPYETTVTATADTGNDVSVTIAIQP